MTVPYLDVKLARRPLSRARTHESLPGCAQPYTQLALTSFFENHPLVSYGEQRHG